MAAHVTRTHTEVATNAPQAQKFAGASILVTGGSRGIGREIALRFADQGASRITISYLRNDSAAEKTAQDIQERGAEPILVRGNIGDPEHTIKMFETAKEIDVIVANAATGVIRPVTELSEKHWDWTMNSNARSFFTLGRLASNYLQPGASIVAISSLGSTRVLENYILVGTSKAAIEALVRYLAIELAPQNIRVNAITAGLVKTEALDHFPNRDEMLEFYLSESPTGRLVEPADIAQLACFLSSEDAHMIRGQTVVLDGGYSLKA